MPIISVVIPTYNRAQFVTAAIDSIMAQSFSDYEIIVIDDGSTDGTKDLLRFYSDKIRYIYQRNKGVSAARNVGIKAARGEWIAFLDSDDEWLSDKLELQHLDLQRYPEAVLSCTNLLFEGGEGTKTVDYFSTCLSLNLQQAEFIPRPFFRLYAFTSSVLAKRSEILAAGLFDEELSIYEDIDLFFRLALRGGFVVNPTPLVRSFRRKEADELNLSATALKDPQKNFQSLVRIFSKLSESKLTANERLFVQKKLSDAWFDLGLAEHKIKRHPTARKCFFASWYARPSLKNFLKLLLGLCGSPGISCIEYRRKTNKGFRRTEHYQHA